MAAAGKQTGRQADKLVECRYCRHQLRRLPGHLTGGECELSQLSSYAINSEFIIIIIFFFTQNCTLYKMIFNKSSIRHNTLKEH